jgi:hypothetical protein
MSENFLFNSVAGIYNCLRFKAAMFRGPQDYQACIRGVFESDNCGGKVRGFYVGKRKREAQGRG